MSVTDQYVCEYAQLDSRSVAAQLRANGDGRNELYDLFLRMEGIGNGLFEKNGDVFDAYAAAMSGAKLTPASAWLLVRLGRVMDRLESISERLAKVAAKYDRAPPSSNGARGRRIQPSFLSENLPSTPSSTGSLSLRR